MTNILPSPRSPIPQTTPQRDAARAFLHGLGLQIVRQRVDSKEYRCLGINYWKHRGLQACGSVGIRQDEEGFPRRINELSDRRYFRSPPWLHMHRDYPDFKPSLYNQTQPIVSQSAYIPSPLLFPEFEPFVLKATGFDDILTLLDAIDAEKSQAKIAA